MKNGLLESKINDMINIVRREDHCGFNKEKKTKQWRAYIQQEIQNEKVTSAINDLFF